MNNDDAIRAVIGIDKETYDEYKFKMQKYVFPLVEQIKYNYERMSEGNVREVDVMNIATTLIIAILVESQLSVEQQLIILSKVVPSLAGGLEALEQFRRMQKNE